MKHKLSELSKEEKIELLKFWLTEYSNVEIPAAALEGLHKVIETKTDDIMNIAILDFLVNTGSYPLISYYMSNNVDSLIQEARKQIEEAEHEETIKCFLEIGTAEFLKTITKEYEESKNPNTKKKAKKSEELTQEEIIELLKHWLRYYGKTRLSQEELEQLHHVIETRTDEVMNLAVLLYNSGEGSTTLIKANRNGKIEKTLAQTEVTMKKINDNPETRETMESIKEEFIEEITKSYQNPEPAKEMSLEEIIHELRKMRIIETDEETKTDMEEEVNKLFELCGFRKGEVVESNPLKPYIVAEGISGNFIFSAERINEHKDRIYELIDQIPGVDYGASFADFGMTKDGREWTNQHWAAEQLMLLGLASDILVYTLPEEYWYAMGGVPRVTRVSSNKEKSVTGKEPETFEETIKQIVKRRREINEK